MKIEARLPGREPFTVDAELDGRLLIFQLGFEGWIVEAGSPVAGQIEAIDATADEVRALIGAGFRSILKLPRGNTP